MVDTNQIGHRVRPDGRVAVKYPNGSTKLLWPIDAREQMATQKGITLADEPAKVRRQADEDKGPQAPLSPRGLVPPPARIPGGKPAIVKSPEIPSAPAGGDDYSDEVG